MNYQELYQAVADRDKNAENWLVTATEGELAGSQALISNGSFAAGAKFYPDTLTAILSDMEKARLLEVEDLNVFAERIGTRSRLVVCGGGHVASAVVRLAKNVGFYVIDIEDRPKFADDVRRIGADEVYCDDYSHALEQIPQSADTYYLVCTRGHRHDADCLRQILKKDSAYVGMLSSKKRAIVMRKQLEEEGFDAAKLEQMHAPVGLKIGGETPEEIAISIAAELIQERKRLRGAEDFDKELLQILTGEKESELAKVLATIIFRRGSAPRQAGAKMLVLEDGRTIGTIGGGCAESNVIREALLMMREDDRTSICRRMQVSMIEEDVDSAEMACGGTIEVLLQYMR